MFHRKYKTPLFVILSVELNLAVHDALDLPGAVREVGAEDAAVVGRVEVAVEDGDRVVGTREGRALAVEVDG